MRDCVYYLQMTEKEGVEWKMCQIETKTKQKNAHKKELLKNKIGR